MPDPLVSVVIPAYNPATFLLEAIASAAAQTYPRAEIILVNDGTDKPESRAILDQASHLVSAYIEQPNRGLGAARNAGFRAARVTMLRRWMPTISSTALTSRNAWPRLTAPAPTPPSPIPIIRFLASGAMGRSPASTTCIDCWITTI